MRLPILLAAGALIATQAGAETATLDLVEPISDYKIYVSEKVDVLVADTAEFVAAVKAGDVLEKGALMVKLGPPPEGP